MKNRIIKFRIWDEKYNCWDECKGSGPFYFYPKEQFSSQNKIFQQFTGLKDKTGREIYEGDLVNFILPRVPTGDLNGIKLPTVNEIHEKKEVWWSEDDLGFLFEKVWVDGWHGYRFYDLEDIEVVGNIFENKDLLE